MRAIAFFLPQYHPIPENDRWWGPGFTEWTNVARARPLFRGHHQPHIPGELGFYDLRLDETREAQAALAVEHGLGGFCYYHYWFNGRELLERPVNEIVASGRPDFPFCLCWANEHWTRAWDGKDREILVRQDYRRYDPGAHMERLAGTFADPRYITVHGRPLLLVYDAGAIPGLPRVVDRWRERAERLGLAGLYLCGVLSTHNRMSVAEFLDSGFDAVAQFQPSGPRHLPAVPGRSLLRSGARLYRRWFSRFGPVVAPILPPGLRPDVRVLDYDAIVQRHLQVKRIPPSVFPCVMPGWDNSPRRRVGATVIQNDDAELYGRWLSHCLDLVSERHPDEQIVFINAWNEWGEGCHLEPDVRNGRAFLEATRRSLARAACVDSEAGVAGLAR
jgi:lipopolysaccharide biosynthesis protein